jgi:hypothetical protein
MQGGLCKRVYAVQELWDDLLEEFAENAAACLLFLKKMERIVVHSLTHGGRREVGLPPHILMQTLLDSISSAAVALAHRLHECAGVGFCVMVSNRVETVCNSVGDGAVQVCRAEVAPGTSAAFLSRRTELFQRILAKPGAGGKLQVGEYHGRLREMAAAMALDAAAGEQFVTVELVTARASRFSRRAGQGAGVRQSKSTWLLCSRVAGGEAVRARVLACHSHV